MGKQEHREDDRKQKGKTELPLFPTPLPLYSYSMLARLPAGASVNNTTRTHTPTGNAGPLSLTDSCRPSGIP